MCAAAVIVHIVAVDWHFAGFGHALVLHLTYRPRCASACLCAAATGYSITRSLREAPAVARAVRVALDEQPSAAAAVRFVWEALWTQERRRQVRLVL